MTTIEDYFDKIYVINLDRRPDKWTQCVEQFEKFNITNYERFSGHDTTKATCGDAFYGGGNYGCTASHRGVLELICHRRHERTLILEDDFHISHNDFHQKFSDMIGELPDEWDMLYLGGHYAENPQYRVSPHVIRIGKMMTTSSYGVTGKFAREIAPKIFGTGPIDCLYFDSHRAKNCYIFQPRLMVQRPSFSDIQHRVMNNSACMEDSRHESTV